MSDNGDPSTTDESAAKSCDGLNSALVGSNHESNRDDKRVGVVSGESADALAAPLKKSTEPHDRDDGLGNARVAAKSRPGRKIEPSDWETLKPPLNHVTA